MTGSALSVGCLAAVCGAAAAWCLVPEPPERRGVGVAGAGPRGWARPARSAGGPGSARHLVGRSGPARGPAAATVVALGVLTVLAGWLLTGSLVLGVAFGVLGGAGLRAYVRGVRRRRVSQRAAVLPDVLRSFAAELRAGRMPEQALQAVARHAPAELAPSLRSIAQVAASGGDVAEQLRAEAREGGEGLALLAACWAVAERGGAPLAPSVERMADALQDQLAVRSRVAAELAGPRSTALILCLLPVAALGMAHSIGADPLAVLRSPLGWGCAGVGVPLLVAGLAWTDALGRAAQRAVALPGEP